LIGVDTNVLLRLFIVDDPRQNALAARFFGERSEDDPAYISVVVLAELMWVLEKKFKFARTDSLRVVGGLLDALDVMVEQRELVEWAFAHATHSKIDFSDVLIAEANRQAGAAHTATFDREAARRVPGMELLK